MKTFQQFILEADDPYARYAKELGFEMIRDRGKHNIYRHKSGAQVPSPKSGSDARGPLNFRRDLRRALTDKGVDWKPKVTQPVQKPQPKPEPTATEKGREARMRYRSGIQVTRVPASQQGTNFSSFLSRLSPKPAAVTPKPSITTPTTTAQPNLFQRMQSAFSRNLGSGQIPKSATTASVRSNTGLSLGLRGGGGGGGFGASMVKPIEPVGSDPISSWARSSAQRKFDQRRLHFRGGI